MSQRRSPRATRPIFVPLSKGPKLYVERSIEFAWHAGLSKARAQMSIADLHREADRLGLGPVLEISSKSAQSLGVALSAFNLKIVLENGCETSVEAAYQGSKVYRVAGGPHPQLYGGTSRAAKEFSREHENDSLEQFDLLGSIWKTSPKTAFYDWLFVTAVRQKFVRDASELLAFNAFSDIAFNPKRSVACQARSAAIFSSLVTRGAIDSACGDPENFRALYEREDIVVSEEEKHDRQRSLFN